MERQEKSSKVLFVLGSMEVGGVQSGIMNFAKIISKDRVRFDVLVLTEKTGFHEEEFKKYGNVYHMPILSSKNKFISIFFSFINDLIFDIKLKKFLKTHKYDAINSKLLAQSGIAVKAAKKRNVPVRVAQSHVDVPKKMNFMSRLYYKINAKRIEKYATHKLAVSPKAAELLFGKYGGRVIKNPTISLERLDPTKYAPVAHDGINLIQIGTYSHRKNQVFAVKILKSLIEKGVKAHLTFIGFPLDEPNYIDEVKAAVKNNGLTDNVTFLPKDADVPKMLAGSDYMLIPSLREGLPNVALEAQAMGVPCFISDTVNPETDCGLCEFLPLGSGADAWAQAIINYREKHGTEKRFIDMSEWDNKKVCEEYIKIWSSEK